MKIHFAFGQLGKRGLIEQQCSQFIELILSHKRLMISKCTEFLPFLPRPNGVQFDKDGTPFIGHEIDLRKGEVCISDDGAALSFDFSNMGIFKKEQHINYAPEDVLMISFIDIPFNKLRRSNHWREYGKLGIVFTDEFYKRTKLRHVFYYTENDVLRDKVIKRWNDGMRDKNLSVAELATLKNEITLFRKPARLFNNFSRSVTAVLSPTDVKFVTYDRYPEGYDFTQERECRLAFTGDVKYLNFDESDIYMIIVPGEREKHLIENYLASAWSVVPLVRLHPE